jgi:uncharacterized protein (DUF2235 family)
MKRLVFCFDGTWNRLDAPCPTNVVLTAQSVSPIARDGTVQIIHYDQGVGTAKGWKWRGGLFGQGLLDNIVDAYTFLVFNYEVGDEIFVFGFSRGAYTARSFVGLLRNVGILRRCDAGRITASVQRYQYRKLDEKIDSESLLQFRLKASPLVCVDQNEDEWRQRNMPGYVSGASHILRIRYVGVWDTVGSLGIPDSLLLAPLLNRKYRFHDCALTDMVVSARHAVSMDEKRKSFAPTLWANVDELNASLGFDGSSERAPYQQKWFPGVHGSVGGGGDIRGLSDCALDWILSGAREAGLQVDTDSNSRVFDLAPDYLAPLENVSDAKPSLLGALMKVLPTAPRLPGPGHSTDVSPSAIARWREPAERLPECALYRPPTLSNVANEMNSIMARGPENKADSHSHNETPLQTSASPAAGHYYKVVRNDTLRGLALKAYRDASKFDLIMKANCTILSDPDRIYIGQVLYIPEG